jgi:hypothetical protein
MNTRTGSRADVENEIRRLSREEGAADEADALLETVKSHRNIVREERRERIDALRHQLADLAPDPID